MKNLLMMRTRESQNCHHHPVKLHGRTCGRMDGSQKAAEISCLRKSLLTNHFVPAFGQEASCRQKSECLKIHDDCYHLPLPNESQTDS